MSNNDSAMNDHNLLDGDPIVVIDNERSDSLLPTDLGRLGLLTPLPPLNPNTSNPFNVDRKSPETRRLTTIVDNEKYSQEDIKRHEKDKKDFDMQQAKQLMDLCVMDMKETWSMSKVRNGTPAQESSKEKTDNLSVEYSAASANGNRVEQENNISPSLLRRSTLPVQIIITSSSDHDNAHKGRQYKGITGLELTGVTGDLNVDTVLLAGEDVNTAPGQESETPQVYNNISDGGIGHDLMNDLIADSLAHRENEETFVTLKADDVSLNTQAMPEQFGTKLKHNIVNFQKRTLGILSPNQALPTKKENDGPRTEIEIVKDDIDSQEAMEEIDLKEDINSHKLEAMESVSQEGKYHKDLSKYDKLRNQCSSKIGCLKHNVMKGVLAKGAHLKDVVNVKMSASKQNIETPLQTTLGIPSYSSPTCPSPHFDGMTTTEARPQRHDHHRCMTTTEARPQFQAPNLMCVENNLTRETAPRDGGVTIIYRPSNPAGYLTTTMVGPSLVRVPIVSMGVNPTFQSPAPPSPILLTHPYDQTRPLYNLPEPAAPPVQSTIIRSPGPLRGYTATHPGPYSVHMPPPLPHPPPPPFESYFSSRQYANRYISPGPSAYLPPQPLTTDPDRNCPGPIESHGSKFIRAVDNLTSFVRLKSNQVKDDIDKRLSSSVSQVSRTSPLASMFMEEGMVQRSSMDSGSDRFRNRSLHTITFDDFMKGTLCCCCWPIGLAARMFIMTVPQNEGPVDSCAKFMSEQMSSFALLLGIAIYFLFFLSWFSVMVVAASK